MIMAEKAIVSREAVNIPVNGKQVKVVHVLGDGFPSPSYYDVFVDDTKVLSDVDAATALYAVGHVGRGRELLPRST
jgi:hypothetical protein